MACNTLLNATEHFKKINLLGVNRSVAPEDYNAVEQEIKDLEKLFKEKYGIVDSFFDLKMVQTPFPSGNGKFTNFRLDFNPKAFAKLDIAVVNYNTAYMAEHFKQGDQFTMFMPTTVKPGVSEVFEANPELTSIGTPAQYSQYLESIFPDSQVKDIVYHGTTAEFDKFDKSFIKRDGVNSFGDKFYFLPKNMLHMIFKSQKIMPVILNMESYTDYFEQGTYETTDNIRRFEESELEELAVNEPEQIHILGSKQDIEGFKTFVNSSSIDVYKNSLRDEENSLSLPTEQDLGLNTDLSQDDFKC